MLRLTALLHFTPDCTNYYAYVEYRIAKIESSTIDLVEKSYGTRLKELESDSNSLLVISSERK